MGAPVKTSEIRQLRCALTDAELQRKAERVAELLQESEDTEAELRSQKSRYKSRLEGLEGERSRVLHDFRTRSEARDVRCDLQLDFELGRATWVRTDTGEPLWDRPLSDAERQQPLFADGGQGEGDEHDETGAEGEGDEAEGRGAAPQPVRGRRRGSKGAETSTAAAV